MSVATPVLIVDDHPVFRFGLASVLAARGFEAVHLADGSVTSAEGLVPPTAASRRWVALLDVRLGAVDGIELCRRLRASGNPPVVIMLSTFDEPAVLQAAREAGAFAFLSKEVGGDAIVAAIEAGLAGGPTRIRDQGMPAFTRRERDVLNLLREGLDNKGIADRLGIAPTTVKDHLDNLYAKLGVSDRLRAVRAAADLGLWDVLS